MSGFLYIEPFEVRKEIIVRPKDMQRWVDLGLDNAEIITADRRGVILEKIAEFLLQRQPVTINGEVATPTLERANFLSRTPGQGDHDLGHVRRAGPAGARSLGGRGRAVQGAAGSRVGGSGVAELPSQPDGPGADHAAIAAFDRGPVVVYPALVGA
jgi:hypothetical protein